MTPRDEPARFVWVDDSEPERVPAVRWDWGAFALGVLATSLWAVFFSVVGVL